VAARLAFALAVVLALAVRAGAETRPDYGGDLSGTLSGEPASLDPVEARSHAEITVIGLVFDTLYRATPEGKLVPHLAAALPEVAGLDVTIRLRRGLTFSDGSALDASDVVASLQRLAKSDAGWLLAPVDTIAASGDDVVLTLTADAPDLAALLAAPQSAITPRGAAPKKTPIGSGPFSIDSIDRGRRRIVLVANDDHFAGRAYLDRLELRWYDDPDAEARQFEDGKLQLSARGATAFSGAQPKYRSGVAEGPATVLSFVGFSRGHAAITGDVDFRRALHLAIARGGLSSSGRGERVTPTADPVPADLGGEALDDDQRGGDTAAAAKALERAAKRVPALAAKRRAELSLEILVDKTRLDDREVAERVVRALDKLGLAATITELGAADLVAKIDQGDGDLWIGQLAPPGPTAALVWAAAFEAGGDSWARKQLAAGKLDAGKARTQFGERLPILPLLHRSVRIHHRDDVRGVGFDASSRLGFADLFLFGKPVKSKRKGGG
jgi:peptide/nickel transport system substrate-binding protein